METSKPVVKITQEEWQARQVRGLAAIINDHPYIVMTHEVTHEPVYQQVAILEGGTGRG